MRIVPVNYRVENRSVMLFFPLLLFVSAVFLEYSGLDIWWVSPFYDAQNQVWLVMPLAATVSSVSILSCCDTVPVTGALGSFSVSPSD